MDISTHISVSGLYSFVLEDFLKMAPRYRNVEISYFYELYCTNCILLYFINNVYWLIYSLYEYVRYEKHKIRG
jgi:hypothetical protein